MTSMFEGQPQKNKPLSNQKKGHLGSRYLRGIHSWTTFSHQ